MSFDASTIAMLKTGIWETVYMTMLSSFLADAQFFLCQQPQSGLHV